MKTINTNQDNISIFTEIYCEICEFMGVFEPVLNKYLIGQRRQRPFCKLSICEIMTILVGYQLIGAQNFKQFYKDIVCQYHRNEFPDLVTYQRFIEVAPIAIVPLMMFLKFRMEMSEETGLYVVDSTHLNVCENIRIPRHKVFDGLAQRGKSSIDWFYGFKLHLIINHLGELMNFRITAGNVDDRKPVRDLVKQLMGKLLGDKGYIKKELVNELSVTFFEYKQKVNEHLYHAAFFICSLSK